MSQETTTESPPTDANKDATPDTGLGNPLTQTADPIDRVVRLAPKWTIFVLVACALLVVGALVWAFQGKVSQTVPAPGIFVDQGSTSITSQTSGTVSSILVERGQTVTANQAVLEFTNGDTVTTPVAGEVSSIFVAAPLELNAGQTIMLVTDINVPDLVYALLPAVMVGSQVAGKPVNIEVSNAPSATYGYLQGTVTDVSEIPLTNAQASATLGIDPELVATALGAEPGQLAVVALTPDSSTPSGYAWTVGDGPPFLLEQGTSVTAQVVLSQQRPIEILFPTAANDSDGS